MTAVLHLGVSQAARTPEAVPRENGAPAATAGATEGIPEAVSMTVCPVCGMAVRVGLPRHGTLGAHARQVMRRHIECKHPGVGTRERSLLCDQAADALREAVP